MKGKALIGLIAILAGLLVCTGIASEYILDNNSGALELSQDGEPYVETVRADNMVPGKSETFSYTAEAQGDATFSVRFVAGNVSDLNEYLTFTVVVNGETLYNGAAAGCFGEAVTAQVSGEFTFSVTYLLAESVGNEAQGLASEFTIEYALEAGN